MLTNEQRTDMLNQALQAFDAGHARRRALRTAAATSCFLLAASVLAWSVWGAADAARRGHTASQSQGAGAIVTVAHSRPEKMPSFVEVIDDVDQLAAELDAAGACEGVGREGDRVFIVECASRQDAR